VPAIVSTLQDLVNRSELSIKDWPHTRRREAVLQLAYERRWCFVCRQYGECQHREDDVEIVIAQYLGIGATL
jgi:hypothetical protein